MPGWSGPETLAALRQLNPGVRVCFLSGHSDPWTDAELLALGAARLFRKPFCLAEFAATLRHLTAM